MNKKTSLRLNAKQIRKSLDIKQISSEIVAKIIELDIYKNSKNIMLFCPKSEEVDVLILINDNDKNFFLPRVNGENIECCPYKKGDNLTLAKFNIQEPQTECISCPKLDLIIVPALAMDKKGNRIGYGGGFYDRFLSNIKGAKSLCGISEALIVEEISSEKFDIKIDYVVTEKNIYITI